MTRWRCVRGFTAYTLGSRLALVGAAALFFDTAGVYATVAILGGGGYTVAAVLERKHLATVEKIGMGQA